MAKRVYKRLVERLPRHSSIAQNDSIHGFVVMTGGTPTPPKTTLLMHVLNSDHLIHSDVMRICRQPIRELFVEAQPDLVAR